MSGAQVVTSTMKPAMKPANGVTPISQSVTSSAQAPKEAPPKPRRRRAKREAPKPVLTEPTAEQLAALGRLTYDAHQRGVTVEEYVDDLRASVEAYDTLFHMS